MFRKIEHLIASCHQASDIDVKTRHRYGSRHKIPIRVSENIAEAGSNLCVLAKESEFVAHLDIQKDMFLGSICHI